MSGKLIPFRTAGSAADAAQTAPPLSSMPSQGIHLVALSEGDTAVRMSATQLQALKIVAEVTRVQRERSAGSQSAARTGRPPQFWATLPVANTRMDTPLTVARRLVHLLVANSAWAAAAATPHGDQDNAPPVGFLIY